MTLIDTACRILPASAAIARLAPVVRDPLALTTIALRANRREPVLVHKRMAVIHALASRNFHSAELSRFVFLQIFWRGRGLG